MPDSSPHEAFAEVRADLLVELSRLREAVLKRLDVAPAAPGQALVLARLCAGLTLDQWEEIAREGHFLQWLAIPLAGDATPHLDRLQRTIEELAHQTRQDPLTGLANRRAFERNLKMELDRAYRGGTPLSLAILDLDDFKAVNDTFGHLCGDRVLLSLAGALLGHKRAYDLAARIGGEEFALLLPGSGLAQAETTLERILQEIRQRKVLCEGVADPVGVTCSAGVVCTKGRAPIPLEQFVDLADKALYQAKRQGKNRLCKAPIPDLFEPSRATLVHAQEKKFLFTGPDT